MAGSSEVPSTMSGMIIEKTGGPEEMILKTDLPVPQPGEGEVLIRNEYTGVNFIDTYQRSGLYPLDKFPHILGSESAGTIAAVGSGEIFGLKPGDRVVSMSNGAYGQYCIGKARCTYKLPDDVETKIAAAVWMQGITAITLTEESYAVKKGDWILLHAAAGGTGLLLLQLLKRAGAHIIATCSTAKMDLVKTHGADIVHDYSTDGALEKLVEVVKKATGGKGVICAYDSVGKTTFDTSLDCLAKNGSLISFGNASGKPDPLVVGRLMPKNLRLMRPTMLVYIEEREDFTRYSEHLAKALESGLDVRIHKVYSFSDVKAAHEDLAGRKTTGKLVLKF